MDGSKIPVVGALQERALAKDRQHKERLDHEVELRRKQEQDKTKGESVWFSRRIIDGHLHHWALFVYSKKYELRLPTREMSKLLPHGGFFKSVVPTVNFEAKISPWTLENQVMDIREKSLAGRGTPQAADYYVCQIGWTLLSAAQVDAECMATQKAFGLYVLGFSDCQTFLKQLARRIILQPDGRALDYDWFAHNTETSYHKLQQISPDANIQKFQNHLIVTFTGAGLAAAAGVAHVAVETDEPSTKGEMMNPTGALDAKKVDQTNSDGSPIHTNDKTATGTTLSSGDQTNVKSNNSTQKDDGNSDGGDCDCDCSCFG